MSAVVLAGAAAGDARAALRFENCRLGECATLRVPLDRAGTVRGSVSLRVTRAGRGRKALLALSGGPGQGGASLPSFMGELLGSAVKGYTIYGLDQRGTGASGVIRCPALQSSVGTSDYALPAPGSVEACGASLGPRRGLYSTTASVEDIEAMRRQLGVAKIAVLGISYGTYVAERYARAYPGNVERLVLDSVVPQENVDALSRPNIARIPVALAEACAKGRCRSFTSDPVADMASLVSRLPLRGTLYSDRGRRGTTSIPSGAALLNLVVTTSLSEDIDARLPAAVASVLDGDPAPLLRLARVNDKLGAGSATDLSAGLHAATLCADVAYPWGGPAAPLDTRRPALEAAAAGIPEDALRPFDRATAAGNGLAVECERWPVTPGIVPPPAPGPLPDVPVLLVNGSRDLSTPVSDAERELARASRGELVVVGGSGHSIITDSLPCVRKSLRLFFAGRRVGSPCRGVDVTPDMRGQDPRNLDAVRPIRGVGGVLGRAMAAAFDTIDDATAMSFAVLTGSSARLGGLRGGATEARLGDDTVRLTLDGVVYVPGVRVSGTLTVSRRIVGRVRVSGRVSGQLVLRRDGTATSTLGGKRIDLTGGRRR